MKGCVLSQRNLNEYKTRLLCLLLILVQIVSAEIITGFNQLEVGNTWTYKLYDIIYGGFPFKEKRGRRIVTIDSMTQSNDTSYYYISQIDSVLMTTQDPAYDTISFDTVITRSWKEKKYGNVLSSVYFTSKDSISTDTLELYDKNTINANMWCRRKVNNVDKLFYIEKWKRAVPFGWLESEDVFIQDLGLIYQMSDGGDHGHLYTDTMTLLTFNEVEVNAELLRDILDENVTGIKKKEIFTNPGNDNGPIPFKVTFSDNKLHLPDIGSPKQISLYNSQGREILLQHTNSNILVLKNLSAGIYHYAITAGENIFHGTFIRVTR